MTDDASGLSAEADRLYALPVGDFTAARDARSRELRASDAALARAVGALRKPVAAAALVNAIARADPDGVAALAELGERLRAAQDAGDGRALAALVRERRDAVRRLLSARPGRIPASAADDVSRTLEAATVDPWAARAVASGRLLRPLVAVGFDPVDLDGAVAVAPDGSAGRAAASGHPAGRSRGGARGRLHAVGADQDGADGRASGSSTAEERRRAARERRVAEAAERVERAESEVELARDDLADRAAEAEAAAASATARRDEVAEAERRLVELTAAAESAERAERDAARQRDEAAATARSALARLDRAREARDALDDH